MIFRRSPNVPVFSDYHQYRDSYLRPDFQYRCAYCLTHEFYFLQGDGGEIDHHRPLHGQDHEFRLSRTCTTTFTGPVAGATWKKETNGRAMQSTRKASASSTLVWKTTMTTGRHMPTVLLRLRPA